MEIETNEGDAPKTDAQMRIEAARQKRREIEQKRERLREGREEAAHAAAEELAALDEAAIFEAEEKHGEKKIRVIRTEMGCVVVKRPNHVLYKKFRDKESARTEDLYGLVSKCIVHPTMQRFDAILDELPGTLDVVADAAIYLAGFRAKELSGK